MVETQKNIMQGAIDSCKDKGKFAVDAGLAESVGSFPMEIEYGDLTGGDAKEFHELNEPFSNSSSSSTTTTTTTNSSKNSDEDCCIADMHSGSKRNQ